MQSDRALLFECTIVYLTVLLGLFNRSSRYGHFDCFQYFSTTNNAAMNNPVYIHMVAGISASAFLVVGLLGQNLNALLILLHIAKFLS